MNFFILIFYEFILWIIALVAIPKVIYSFFVHNKYRNSLLPRLGFNRPQFHQGSPPSIWIHAVSVGETKAMVSLARQLKFLFPNNPLIISSISETGHEEAKRSLPFADYHIFLPFDFKWSICKLIQEASPGLVILCESDFWYNFLYFAKKNGAALVLVNGKISEKSMRWFRRIPFFSNRLFNLFDLLCIQNAVYRTRFLEAGALLEKMVITGNLKLDEEYPQLPGDEITLWRQKLGIMPDEIVLTIGSSHLPEEKFFISVLKEVWKKFPKLRVIVVPRHPEKFKEVAALLDKERLLWVGFTDINRRVGNEQVILIDAMGLLRMCYQLSNIAIVAGSFIDTVGGHNIIEPCWYGVPVLFGPHMETQFELVSLIKQYEAGIQVEDDQLKDKLEEWVAKPEIREKIGKNGLHLVNDLKGSTQRTLSAMEPFFATLK